MRCGGDLVEDRVVSFHIYIYTGDREKVGPRRQSIVHEEITAIGVDYDVNLNKGWVS